MAEGLHMETSTRAITPQDAAERLSLNVRTIYRLLESGQIRGFRVGRVWRIPVDALREYMDEARRTQAAIPADARERDSNDP